MNNLWIKWIERSLGFTLWCLLGSAAWIMVDGLFLGKEVGKLQLGSEIKSNNLSEIRNQDIELQQLAGIWKRDLRQRLIEPPPVKKKQEKKKTPPKTSKPPKLPTLVATWIGGEERKGVFHVSGAKGGKQVKRISETIDGFEVVKIMPGAVELRRKNKTYKIKVPRMKNNTKSSKPKRVWRR